MKRILLIAAMATAASGIATAPAIAGLVGNQSFSHDLPVRVPSNATSPSLVADDHGSDRTSPITSITPVSAPTSSDNLPGDDHGGVTASRTPEPGDDNGATTEPSEAATEGSEHTQPATTGTASGHDDGATTTESESPEPSATSTVDDHGGTSGSGTSGSGSSGSSGSSGDGSSGGASSTDSPSSGSDG